MGSDILKVAVRVLDLLNCFEWKLHDVLVT